MCTITLTTMPRNPLALVALARDPLALTEPVRAPIALLEVQRDPLALAELASLPLRPAARLAQRRLTTNTAAYLATQDGRRIVVGVCNA